MKLLRSAKDKLVFQLSRREKDLLLSVLQLYPRVPSAYQAISKKAILPDQKASQALLDEALAEQRAENKKRLQALLEAPRRFEETDHGWHLTLTAVEVEYLLQILNDIRVGSWIILGSPEERLSRLTAKNAPHIWAMEMAGSFQMHLLEGLEG